MSLNRVEMGKKIAAKIRDACKKHKGAKFPMLSVQVRHPEFGWQTIVASNHEAVLINDALYFWVEFKGQAMFAISEITGDQVWSVLFSFDPKEGA